MPEYLSKEEILKWRRSLERITLEEYAARLGKVIQEERHDDSLVDTVMIRSLSSMTTEKYVPATEKIQSLAIKSFDKEKGVTPKKEVKATVKKEIVEKKSVKVSTKKETVKAEKSVASDKINYSFKKNLTTREQMVFDHFLENRNTIVYAKDLAQILELPRDYVYKYIKNLRAKIEGDKLQNAPTGGFILTE
jgi:predicted transcriptional regulator